MKYATYLLFIFFFPIALSAQLVGDKENGLASYFSPEYDKRETAYKVIYHKDELVAAHRQFPFNSTVRVKNMDNGKTVDVRIIDEGPFIRSRIIELSERAAAIIGLLGKETVPVELTLLSTPNQPAVAIAPEPPVNNDPVVTPNASEPDPAPAAPPQVTPAPTPAENPAVVTPQPAPVTTPPPSVSQTAPPRPTVSDAGKEVKTTRVSSKHETLRKSEFAPGVYKINLSEPPAGTHGVQVGSFSDLESAMDKVAELQSKWFDDILIERVNIGTASRFKVILGPFKSLKSAQRYASDLKKRYKMDGFAVPIR